MQSSSRFVLLLATLSLAGCPGPDPGTPDSGVTPGIDAGPACTTAADCDDGLFCTGTEACTAGRCVRTPIDCDDGVACTIDRCSEERLRCEHTAPDLDEDGYGDAACAGGNDCDDDDAGRFPGNHEICDGDDEDCIDTTLGDLDADSDGYVSDECCNGASCGDDCDDARNGTYPGATEVCDGLDQNCDDTVDDGVGLAGFVDADRDGWGDTDQPLTACASAPGWAPADHGGDCEDDLTTNEDARAINPGQPEICDGFRNDCDETLDADVGAGAVEWFGDVDGDGFGARSSGVTLSCTPVPNASLLGTDCDDAVAGRSPAATEVCNALDDDCNGAADFRIAAGDFEDDDDDDLVDFACIGGTDCNDRDPASGPGSTETCDGRDNDCDGTVDEGATSIVYYRDLDADGFGSTASGSIVACMASAGHVARGGDCNDADPLRYPGATETCNAADEDCDAAVDEAPASVMCVLPGASTTTCVVGRCTIGDCTTGFSDCNGRDVDGCEVDTRSSALHCGACGAACTSGATCVGSSCECSAGSVECSVGCIDPRRDERFCGASSTCSDVAAGTTCRASELCRYGTCVRSQIFPGAAAGFTGIRPRAVRYTIDAPGPASIEYTLDGTTPGVSPTTMMAAAPVSVMLDGVAARVRWRARYTDGDVEPLQTFTHTTDATSRGPVSGEPYSPMPVDNHRSIVENVEINGDGPIVVVPPSTAFTFTFNVQYWHGTSNGYCPGCVVYASVTFGPTGGTLLGCVGLSSALYPGMTTTGFSGSGTSPPFAGVYPIMLTQTLAGSCLPGGGEPVGWVVVDGPTAPPS